MGGGQVRIGEYLPWIIATVATLLFVNAVLPGRWSDRKKITFKVLVGISFFLGIGVYWLATGEKFDETAYRILLCKIYQFERCLPAEKADQAKTSEQIAREVEALRKTAEDFRREQREAARRAEEEREAAEKKRLAEEQAKAKAEAAAAARRAADEREAAEKKRLADEQAKAKAERETAIEALRQREAAGRLAIANAFKYWRQRNFKVAADYAENALKVFSELPNSNEREIRNMTAEAHMIVGFGLALLGATPKDKAYGCSRLKMARNIYYEIGNTPMVSRTDQDLSTAGCS